MVAGSGMLRVLPASSRQRRTSCLDETVINLEISNFRKEPKAPTYGYSATATDKSDSDTPCNNAGDHRGFSVPGRCQTSGRGSATPNQQRPAVAGGRHFPRSDRSLCQRRDRTGRPRAHNQGTRPQPHQQPHLAEVGQVPTEGCQTLPGTRLASKIASRSQNQRSPARADVPTVREGYALGTDSHRTEPDGPGRAQRSQQAAPAPHAS